MILVAASASVTHAAMWVESVVIAADALRERGFVLEARTATGAMPSLEVSVRVPPDTKEEQFIKTGLVLTKFPVSRDNLEKADRDQELPRTEKTDRVADFVYFSKSLDRGYLTISFRCPDSKGMKHEKTYLVLLSDLNAH